MAKTASGFPSSRSRWSRARTVAVIVVAALLATGSPTSVGAQNTPFEGEVLTIVGTETSPEAIEAITTALAPFERVSGTTVLYTPSLDPAAQIELQVAAGAAPDLVMVGDSLARELIADGTARPIAPELLEITEFSFNSALLDMATVGGRRYGIPVQAQVSSNLWFKPSIFSTNGYFEPLSWAGLRTLATRMIGDANNPFCIGIADGADTGWVVADWIEDQVLRLGGPDVYDAWIANEIPFSNEAVAQAFAQVLDLWSTPSVTRGGLPGILADSPYAEPAQGLSANECAMVRQRSDFVNFLDDDALADVDVFAVPGDLGERPLIANITWGLALSDRPATDALVEYVGSASYASIRQATQQAAVDAGGPSGFLTANVRVDASLWHPAEATMNEMLQDASVIRADGSDAMPEDVASVFVAEARAMIEGKDLAEVLATIDAVLPPIVNEPTCEGLEITISGTDGDDVITGTLGADVIDGGAGDDIIAGAGGADIICGGPGNDTIWGNIGDDLLIGGEGDDKLRGGSGNDELRGGDGADDLAGATGDDLVDGGPGDDLVIRGGTGDDRLFGGDGNEALMNGNGGEDEVYGDGGADVVNGGPRPDRLFGGDGDDELKGNKGADQMWGEAGDDLLRGGPQADSLDGGDGEDDCNGGTESDSAIDCETETFIELECLGIYVANALGCVTPNATCLSPQLELETIPGVAMIDPVTGESVAEPDYACVLECEAPAELAQPGRCVLALP